LAQGSYTFSAEKPSYVPARYPDTTGHTFRTMPRPIALADGQVVEGVNVLMFRGGAIVGRIVDAHGDPVEFASVHAIRGPRAGRGRLQVHNGTSTNDIGEFRLARLAPGKYLIFVMPRRDMFKEPISSPAPTEVVEPQLAS